MERNFLEGFIVAQVIIARNGSAGEAQLKTAIMLLLHHRKVMDLQGISEAVNRSEKHLSDRILRSLVLDRKIQGSSDGVSLLPAGVSEVQQTILNALKAKRIII